MHICLFICLFIYLFIIFCLFIYIYTYTRLVCWYSKLSQSFFLSQDLPLAQEGKSCARGVNEVNLGIGASMGEISDKNAVAKALIMPWQANITMPKVPFCGWVLYEKTQGIPFVILASLELMSRPQFRFTSHAIVFHMWLKDIAAANVETGEKTEEAWPQCIHLLNMLNMLNHQ